MIKKLKGLRYLLLIIVAVGLFFRVRPALLSELWLDEVFSLQFSQLATMDLITSSGSYADLVHPTLYYLILKVWAMVSIKEIWLRLPSLFAFIGSSIYLLKIGKIIKNEESGLVSTLIFAISPFFSNLGFQVRMYSLAIFFSLGGMYYFLRYIKSDRKKWNFCLLASLFISLGVYTSYGVIWLAFALSISEFFHLISSRKLDFQNYLFTLATAVLCSYQLLILVANLLSKTPPIPASVGSQLNTHVFMSEVGLLFGFSPETNLVFLLILLLIITLSIIYLFTKKLIQLDKLFLLLVCCLTPLVFSALFSLYKYNIFLARNLFISALMFAVLLGYIISSFNSVKVRLGWIWLSVYILFLSIQSYYYVDFHFAVKYMQIADEIFSSSKPRLVLLGETYSLPLTYYYLPKMNRSSIVTTTQLFMSNELTTELHSCKEDTFFIFYSYPCTITEECIRLKKYFSNEFCISNLCKRFEEI